METGDNILAGCHGNVPTTLGADALDRYCRHIGASRPDPIGTLGTKTADQSEPALNSRLFVLTAALLANRTERALLSHPIAKRIAAKYTYVRAADSCGAQVRKAYLSPG